MDFPKKQEDKLNTIVILAIGLASCALVYASVIAVQALYRSSTDEYVSEKRLKGISADKDRLYNEQYGKIATANVAEGRLPIEKSKSLVIERLAKARNDGNPSLEANLVPKVGTMDMASYVAEAGIPQPVETEPAAPAAPAPVADDAASGEPAAATPAAATPAAATPATPAAATPAAPAKPAPKPIKIGT